MLTLSHYEFKAFLKWKAWENSKLVIDCNEAYTSKTVSGTGEIVQNLGGARTIKSQATLVDDGSGSKWCSWDFPSGIG